MRIEAQGKYLQTILEKAQKSLSADTNGTGGLETAQAQLSDFNLSLSNLMENVSEMDTKGNHISEVRDVYENNNNNSSFKIYEEGNREESSKDSKLKETINFDLNAKGGYDFFGSNGVELEPKMLSYGR